MLGTLARAFIGEVILIGVLVVVRVEDDVIIVLRTTTSIAIIAVFRGITSIGTLGVMLISPISMLVGLFCFSKRIFAGFAF